MTIHIGQPRIYEIKAWSLTFFGFIKLYHKLFVHTLNIGYFLYLSRFFQLSIISFVRSPSAFSSLMLSNIPLIHLFVSFVILGTSLIFGISLMIYLTESFLEPKQLEKRIEITNIGIKIFILFIKSSSDFHLLYNHSTNDSKKCWRFYFHRKCPSVPST